MMTRTMIVARQNETIRRHEGEDLTDLATIDLQSCVAIVLYNKKEKGAASLTHVDVFTDFKFIEEEYKFCGGNCHITVIGCEKDLSLYYDIFDGYRSRFLPPEASIGRLVTPTGCVFLTFNKFHRPIQAQIELVTQGIYSEEQKQSLRKGNKANFKTNPEFSATHVRADYGQEFNLRSKIAQIESFISACFDKLILRKPVIAYDNGWLVNNRNINICDSVIHKVNEVRKEYESKIPTTKRSATTLGQYLSTQFYSTDSAGRQILQNELPGSLQLFWEYQDKNKITQIPTQSITATDNLVSQVNSNLSVTHMDSPLSLSGQSHEQLVGRIEQIANAHPQITKDFLELLTERKYNSALQSACNKKQDKARWFDVIKIILEYIGKLPIEINQQWGHEKKTAIHHAALSSNQELYNYLISKGADPSIPDIKGRTATEYSIPGSAMNFSPV